MKKVIIQRYKNGKCKIKIMGEWIEMSNLNYSNKDFISCANCGKKHIIWDFTKKIK